MAPPCSGPHKAQMPAEIEANRFASRADHPHGRRAAILLVVGMHDQQQVQRSTKSGSSWYGSLGTENIIRRKFSQ